ncbi:hypothetical protein CVT24_003919 [Panaeolus cyanescens]|uniref:Enoyl reductase (ER) domain-containing protein n=1 Tax=Panaeolus cyanescens TaxID=181874 RepID=A0A409W8I9_9AGAR|nr:hypothetical protein CVT24_003919 [Panaeolus cyanescens]
MSSENKIPTTTQSYVLPETGTYKNLVLRETSIPAIGPNDALIKVHAVSLQYRDLLVVSGKYGLAKIPSNLIPCSDMAGEILALGSSASASSNPLNKWKVGDRVCANFTPDHLHGDATPEIMASAFGANVDGVLTEYKVVPVHSLVEIPDHLSYEEASTLPYVPVPLIPYLERPHSLTHSLTHSRMAKNRCAALTAYNALHGPVPIKAGDHVLVLGTGGVSIFALQFAVAAGATVIATSSSDVKLKIASKLGAKHVINYKTTPEWEKEVLRITNGRGVDHTIEVSGTLDQSIAATKMGSGQIHIIGFVSGSGSAPSVFPIIGRAVTLRGILIGSVAQ